MINDNTPNIALLVDQGTIYWSSYTPQIQEPHSAVTQLIQGIYQNFPQKALRLLRNPIETNFTPTLLCRGMVRIAAKRIRWNPLVHGLLDRGSKDLVRVQFQVSLVDQAPALAFMDEPSLLKWLKGAPLTSNDHPRYQSHRAVRAALKTKEIESYIVSENQNALNKTFHAEILLLQSYYAKHQKGFDSATTLFTSLQCCKMCAAMFWHMHSNPWNNLKSYYLNPEMGPSARDTLFTPNGNLRRQLGQSKLQLETPLEFQIKDI